MSIFVSVLVTALVMGGVIAAMAVGVMAGRAPIKGSCGGMGAVGIDAACELCGGDPKRCEEETQQSAVRQRLPESTSDQFYRADQ